MVHAHRRRAASARSRRLLAVSAAACLTLAGTPLTGSAAGPSDVGSTAAPEARVGAAGDRTGERLPSGGRSAGDSRAGAATGRAAQAAQAGTYDFPAGDERYHTYAEMTTEVAAIAAAHPAIVKRFSIGRSYQGRELWAVKVSDNVTVDESEPEVLFDGLLHAREHMTLEMTLYIFNELVRGYDRGDARITRIVDSREIWIVFALNPDGAEYDIRDGYYRGWRKTRQPTPGSSHVGTDPNRNFPYRWGCCGGSSGDPSSSRFRGPAPLSTPEARAFRDFIDSRVVNGRQQIRTAASFHTSGRLVMWQYGYTKVDVPPDMTRDDHAALVAMGRHMASTKGYTAGQGSDVLYITDGSATMYMYGRHRIFVYTFELTTGSYAPDEAIGSETRLNREAVLYLMEQADCPYRASGKAAQNCGPLYEDFEIARGWRIDPYGTDNAASGRFQRGNPEWTSSNGYKQRGTTTSGSLDLVTGRLAGSSVGTHDVDGGVTSARSPSIALRGGSPYWLSFRYYFAHSPLASSVDHLRVSVVRADGSRTRVFQRVGTGRDVDAAWTTARIDLSAYAGQTIRLLFEAADHGTNSLIEAGIDDVRVTRQ